LFFSLQIITSNPCRGYGSNLLKDVVERRS
jgi:hypothetical protein